MAEQNECECACECQRDESSTFARVLYAPLNGEIVYEDEDAMLDYEGALVGVYTLSHIARVDVEPTRAILRIVDIP